MELWFTEKHRPGAGLTLRIKKTLYSKKSRFQQIDVLETEEFGRMLLLDGLVMTTEGDEFIYHEMLVHPPMHIHGNAQNILIIGGGDGGAVRETLKYPFVSQVTLCEIDKDVVEVSKEFFPGISCRIEDPRVKIVYEDGSKILEGLEKQIDLILVDSTDPIGAAKALFTRQFYQACLRALKPDGILCAQSESPIYHLEIIREMKADLIEAGFKGVKFYTAPIPTYPGGYWSWVIAAKEEEKLHVSHSPLLTNDQYNSMHYFNLEILKATFCLPNFLQNALR